jgi:hypothetical protein
LEKIQESVPHSEKKKNVNISICQPTFSFPSRARKRVELSLLDFYLWGQIKTLMHSAPTENEQTLYQRTFYDC